MALTILNLFLVSLIPLGCAVILMILEVYTKFKFLKKKYKTIIVSTIFSITCIVGTLLSVKTSTGAAINVRDASPIIAGLIFGGPAGIISGLVGGAFRFVAAYWDPSLMPTQIACSIATAMAGIFTAFVRKFIFNNHHGKWYYGVFIAILVEDFHMLLAFVTNINDTALAYQIVSTSFVPMLVTNSLAVCFASIFACLLAKEPLFTKVKKNNFKLTTKIQLSLAGLLLVAYALVSTFGYLSVYGTARRNVVHNFETEINDVKGNVDSEVNSYMAETVIKVGAEADEYIALSMQDPILYPMTSFNDVLKGLEAKWQLSEINIVGKDNYVKYSTQGYDNPPFNMADPKNLQSREFICLNRGTTVFVQDICEPSSARPEQGRTKYAGCVLDNNSYELGFIQIGLYENLYHKLLDEHVEDCATYRHIEQNGFLAVTNDKGEVISITYSDFTQYIDKIDIASLPNDLYTEFKITANNETRSYYTYQVQSEGYHIIAFGDVNETLLPAQISIMGITLVQIFAFIMLYFVLYIIIKHVVTNRIENIESGLMKISNGDLDVKINERNSYEMNALSDNINKTVDSLKEYARKEKQKNAEELNFAKTIQHSVIPTVFPLSEKFEIYSSMETARAVGGDFYDFFYIDADHLAIEVADVSGKGIPAALFMMQAKTTIKNLVETGMPIDAAYTEANRRLCETNDAQMFVTAWIGVVNLTNGHVEYVNAGHNPPIIRNEQGEYVYLKSRPGFVLGGYDSYKYTMQSFDLKPGEKIYLYTDGVTEAMNKDRVLFGEERLLKIINENKNRGPNTICRTIKEEITKHVNGYEQSDDITMLCFALNGRDGIDVMVVDAKIENMQNITQYIDKLLDEHGCQEKIKFDINVAIDELFSNICYYAYKLDENGKVKIIIDFRVENCVSLIFEDYGVKYNPLEKKDPNANATLDEREIGGLGIFIVKKTMDSMEYQYINNHNILKITKTIK